jgi:uncharacterized cofD-like protein
VTSTVPDARAPRVVALGGGHGLATALRAMRKYAGTITAIASVADDGGSSGRLRRELGVLPPGDLRKCLVALAEDGVWARAFEFRFDDGELRGHALGNLVLVSLFETVGDPVTALDEAGRLVGAVGRVLPATREPVVLKARVGEHEVEGQVAVATIEGRISRVELVPADAAAVPDAVAAIRAADQVVLAPGSLYTSVLAALVVPELRDALAAASGPVVQVANLRAEVPETEGLDAVDHLDAVLDHGGRVDTYLLAERARLAADPEAIAARGVRPVTADVADSGASVHDVERLASALAALL